MTTLQAQTQILERREKLAALPQYNVVYAFLYNQRAIDVFREASQKTTTNKTVLGIKDGKIGTISIAKRIPGDKAEERVIAVTTQLTPEKAIEGLGRVLGVRRAAATFQAALG